MKKRLLAKRNALLAFGDYSWGARALTIVVFVLMIRIIAPSFFWSMLSPVFRIADSIAMVSHVTFASFADTVALVTEKERLEREKVELVNENQILRMRVEDVSALLDGRGPAQPEEQEILAGVVSRPPESPYDTLVVAKGSRSGVVDGMIAFGSGGVPIGTVATVFTDFSYITLFSSSGTEIQGWVGDKRIPVKIIGLGGGAMHVALSRSVDVAVGDVLSIPGSGALPIGIVVRIDSDPSSPEITLRVTPMINIFTVTWVTLRPTWMTAGVQPLTATSTQL